MKVQSIVNLSDVVKKSNDVVLPKTLLDKKIELSNPEVVKGDDFFIHYDMDKKLLELRYMEYDIYRNDYWEDLDIGELINGGSINLHEKIESLVEENHPYFLIATYEHGSVYHYPVHSQHDIHTCRWDTGIKSIFVPSDSFIEECNNDSEKMLERLKSYFEEYSDWCNGNVYILCKDTYTADDKEILFISESDSVGGFIGYKNASESLKSYF